MVRGGSSIFRWARNEDFQYGILRFWENYGRETVFSTLDGAGNYRGKKREIEIRSSNHKKQYFDIWASLKKFPFSFQHLSDLEHFEDF